ncbi:helix-turn-helix domain-containing protein [Undibacterium sp.]|jgi:AcrR family transcriptional regulator|uniref:TetR/AcrR family transcriptional regulator n=1 Tax=Undibacterium sp. TaxID=1914977 RepID=UPI002C010F98|nr:helix-turn-helix domain-containing protein [Undibacterium sp.]HTD06372.1 helix-turn-helix domain-containing protein [Undibacterium sp.]
MTLQDTRKRLNREQSQAQTRERLIEAGRKLFVRHGFGGASIRDIAEEAGYSQGAFYSNFSDKEAILLELLRGHMETEAAQLAAVFETAGRSEDDVFKALDAWAAALHADADWAMLSIELQMHANRSPAFAVEYGAVWKAHRTALGLLIGRLFQHLDRIPPAEPEELAAGFMALAHGLGLQRATISPDPTGRMIMIFLRGLLAAASRVVS